MSSPLQIRIISDTGEVVSLLSSDTRQGSILNTTIVAEKIGGLKEFTFTLDRKTDVPLFNSMICEIYLEGSKKFTGYTLTVPTVESNNPELFIEGRGFYFKLEEKFITQTFTSTTIEAAIAAINLTGTGVKYNASKIDANVSLTNIEFKDKSIENILTSFLKIANQDFNTTEYIWGVDEEMELYFYPIPEEPKASLFEGFQFQTPSVDVIDEVINTVDAWRTKTGAPGETEFVATYIDSGSIDRNAPRARKLIFPDFANASDIQNIADAIIQRNLDPKKRIKISNLNIGVLDFGKYNISIKPEEYFSVINEADSLDGWDLSGAPNMPVTVSDEQVLTGRASLKFEPNASAQGNFARYTLPIKLNAPLLLRVYVYFLNDPSDISVIFSDSFSSSITITPDSTNTAAVNQWLKYTDTIDKNIIEGLCTVGDYWQLDFGTNPGETVFENIFDFGSDPLGTPAYILEGGGLI